MRVTMGELSEVYLLGVGAHPDDVEMSAGGVMAIEAARGNKTALLDLTAGELGTRGTPELRAREAADAAQILGVSARYQLGLADGFVTPDTDSKRKAAAAIRQLKPRIMLVNAPEDRHPDHGAAARLMVEAAFMAGLSALVLHNEAGEALPAHRPDLVYHYIQDRSLKPDLVVDVSAVWGQRMKAVAAYKSQFYDPNSQEPATYISSERFWQHMDARGREAGHLIGAEYGESLIVTRTPGITHLGALI